MALGTFPGNCPHCGTRRVSFRILNIIPNDDSISHKDIFAICQNCDRGVAGEAYLVYNRTENSYKFEDIKILPFRSNYLTLKYIPTGVEVNFTEGEASMWDGRYNAAGMVFRKALELGMKAKFPNFEGRLKNCIDRAQKEGLLTEEMANWAHRIRSIGNDAAHEDQFSKEDAEELQTFTHLVLLYLFTLPGMMENAQEGKKIKSWKRR